MLGSIGPIFTIFSPYGTGRYLTLFSDRSGDVAMATNFRVKFGEIVLFTFIHRFGIPK